MQRLLSIPHGSCLVEMLVDDLARLPADELQRTLVLMPTRRLQLQIAARLASRGSGASWLPKMATWDQFVLAETFPFTEDRQALGTAAAELLLAEMIKSRGADIQGISEGHAHELLHFLQELWRHGKRDAGLEPLKSWLMTQWQIEPEASVEIEERATRIYKVIDTFEAVLKAEGYALQEELNAYAIHAWREALRAESWQAQAEVDRIIVAGLTSLPECQLHLLEALTKNQTTHVEVWLDTPWNALSSDAPLRRIRAVAGSTLKATEEPISINHVARLQAAKDPFCESAAALGRALYAVSQGIAPHRVAILIPDEGQYASSFATLSEQLKLRRNIPLSRPWSTTQAGGWITMLQRWVAGRESTAFAALAQSKHSARILFSSTDSTTLRETFASSVSRWLRDAPRTIDSKTMFELSLAALHLSEEALTLFHKAWDSFQGSKILSLMEQELHWSSLFSPMIADLATNDKDLIESLAWQSLAEAESEVRHLPRPLTLYARTWAGFINAVVKLAQNSTLRETGEPLTDLQIISITEARYVPLDVAIIVGCVEGTFPHKVPRDALVDYTLKTALGLPGWTQLEALEDSTFGLLVSRIPRVELMWPEVIGETATVRSRWVEKIHAEGLPIVREADAVLETLFHGTKSPRAKTPVDLDLEGVAANQESILGKVSASSLKALMACPYQFLLRNRGVQALKRREDEDPIMIGNLLHRVIEACLKPHKAIEQQLPHDLRWRNQFADQQDVATWALGRLRSISRVVIPATLQSNPEILQITQRSWKQLADDWSVFYKLGMNPADALVEERFSQERPVYLNLSGRLITVTGAIDVIHHSAKNRDWMICDYKTGGIPTPASVKQGLEPQLVLYTMCLLAADDGFKPEHGIITYRSLKSGELATISVGREALATWSGPFGPCKLDLTQLIADFSTQWLGRITSIETEKRFYADSNQCGFCDFADVCRKDDPRFRDRILAQTEVSYGTVP